MRRIAPGNHGWSPADLVVILLQAAVKPRQAAVRAHVEQLVTREDMGCRYYVSPAANERDRAGQTGKSPMTSS
jgi:hypothetical protein